MTDEAKNRMKVCMFGAEVSTLDLTGNWYVNVTRQSWSPTAPKSRNALCWATWSSREMMAWVVSHPDWSSSKVMRNDIGLFWRSIERHTCCYESECTNPIVLVIIILGSSVWALDMGKELTMMMMISEVSGLWPRVYFGDEVSFNTRWLDRVKLE